MSGETESKATGNEPASNGEPPEGGDPGTAGGQPGAGASDTTDWKKMYLESKEAQERANRLKRELEAAQRRLETLEAERTEPPAGNAPDDGDDDAWDEVEAAGKAGAKWAKVMISERNRRIADEERRATAERLANDRAQLERLVPGSLADPAVKAAREKIAAHYLNNQHRFGDPEAAASDLRARELAEETKKLQEERDKLAAENAALKAGKPPGGPPLAERQVTGKQAEERRKRAEWHAERIAKLEAGDRAGAMAMDKRLKAREVELYD